MQLPRLHVTYLISVQGQNTRCRTQPFPVSEADNMDAKKSSARKRFISIHQMTSFRKINIHKTSPQRNTCNVWHLIYSTTTLLSTQTKSSECLTQLSEFDHISQVLIHLLIGFTHRIVSITKSFCWYPSVC
jgi:hypothetical protein